MIWLYIYLGTVALWWLYWITSAARISEDLAKANGMDIQKVKKFSHLLANVAPIWPLVALKILFVSSVKLFTGKGL